MQAKQEDHFSAMEIPLNLEVADLNPAFSLTKDVIGQFFLFQSSHL
jgi:hypothetical protein